MNLFQCADTVLDTRPTSSIIQTPLGSIRLEAILDGVETSVIQPTQVFRLNSGGLVICWYQQNFDMELLICRPIVSLPREAQLIDCWAGIWRLRAKTPINSCDFSAIWEQDSTWTETNPESSQFVYAKTWEDENTVVMIATDDGEGLAHRARFGDGIPIEWKPYFIGTPGNFDWFSLQTIHSEMRHNGLPIPLPPLYIGQQCQVHFILAWSASENSELITSIGSDLKASEILMGAACS